MNLEGIFLNNIKIIRATVEYADSYCKAVEKVAKERKFLAAVEGFPLDSTIGFVKMIEEKGLAQFYAIEKGIVIGWCDILPKSFEGLKHVGNLGMGVIEEYRGQGIGSKLLDHTIRFAQFNNGIEKIELEVFESNTDAIRLYEKYGFSHEGRRVKSRKLDGEYDNIVLMGKQLL